MAAATKKISTNLSNSSPCKMQEGIAALSNHKTDPDALAQLADPNENMCFIFFTIGACMS